MNSRPFETFRELIDALPPKALLKAAAMRQRKLEEDLTLRRPLDEDTLLILGFCKFLEGAVHGSLVLPDSLPADKWSFYSRTVKRLVMAEELPSDVKSAIDATFKKVSCGIMA